MSAGGKMDCRVAAPLLVFLACDEVSAQERAALEEHLAACTECRELAQQEGQFHAELNALPQSADELDRSGTLLSQCRSELAETLDEMSIPAEPERWQPFGFVRRWMALRPGWSAAGLLAAGAVLGVQLLQWMPTNDSGLKGAAVNVSAAPKVSDEQLAKMAVAGINFAPGAGAAPGTLQVQLRAEQPVTLSGNLDDSDVRRVLTYMVKNGERFDAGLRLDCLEALKARVSDVEIREALLEAARQDPNPAVRMKALEALRDAVKEEDVRDALLESVQTDWNPGVRVEAVNLLVRSLELESASPAEAPAAGDAAEAAGPRSPAMPAIAPSAPVILTDADPSVLRVVRALEELQKHDPNRYVRLRSAAALRQIGTPEVR
ncbi:MAG TPA: HEAT repeat domain-containing protein [Dongiaceae bacterium]|nr:HEAT repeat domain-containing protein [Dongiaceae bacterium]